jgi:hypothetical protein
MRSVSKNPAEPPASTNGWVLALLDKITLDQEEL